MAEIIIALDYRSSRRALSLVDTLGPSADFYKVGLELFGREGPGLVKALREREKRVFLDLKLHDIPNTVARAVEGIVELGVDLLTIHVAGGPAMLEAAAEAAREGTRLLGVTILTSLSVDEIEWVWDRRLTSLRHEVVRLAKMASKAGLAGVIASPREVAVLKRTLGNDFLVVTPGIRLPGGEVHDQRRTSTPRRAAREGSDFLVVGRTITRADDPEKALALVQDGLDLGVGSGIR